MGLEKYVDPNFKKEISWGNLDLSSFQHEFLNDRRNLPSNAELDAPDLEKQLSIFAPDIVVTYGYFQKLSRRAYRGRIRRGFPLLISQIASFGTGRVVGRNLLSVFGELDILRRSITS